jgi:hypothetical protein
VRTSATGPIFLERKGGGLAGTLEALAGPALLVGGVALLSASWRKRAGTKAHLRIGGWLLILAGMVLFARAWGPELGSAYALLALSLAAYGIAAAGVERRDVAAGVERRDAPARVARELALEPEERPTNWRRGIAKSLLAIVLAGVAAIGIGVAFAVAMPMPAHDRIIVGGILVPVLWGGGMAWTLSDARLLRATVLLLVVSAVSYAIAFLPKVLS